MIPETIAPEELYVAQDGTVYLLNQHAISRISQQGEATVLVDFDAQTGPERFFGLYVDPDGSIYTAGRTSFGASFQLWKFDTNGNGTIVGGNGTVEPLTGVPATESSLPSFIRGVQSDADGNIYFGGDTESFEGLVSKIDASGVLSIVAGGGADFGSETATGFKLSSIRDLFVTPEGELYIAESFRIYRVDVLGKITTLLNQSAGRFEARGIWVDSDGVVYITDRFNDRIIRLEPAPPMPTDDQSTDKSPDFDGDGTVGFSDFLDFALVFGATSESPSFDAKFDLDESGDIGFGDFLVFAAAFGS